uniref:Secreted protein n=1 Tax=Rhabditophanes sp. KR3021 TaxID=114890 RepID=A0AC35UHD7_9BILA
MKFVTLIFAIVLLASTTYCSPINKRNFQFASAGASASNTITTTSTQQVIPPNSSICAGTLTDIFSTCYNLVQRCINCIRGVETSLYAGRKFFENVKNE